MKNNYLRRYTDLPAVIYLLKTKQISLLDPKSWDDLNDSYYLSLYKEKGKLKSLLALCFTQIGETYHHWKIFSGNSSGVCVVFERNKLLSVLKKQVGIRSSAVLYLTINENKSKIQKLAQLPFIKRRAFFDEREYRIIYKSKKKRLSKIDFPIHVDCISRIVLNPWIHRSLAIEIVGLLKSIDGCENLEIKRSTLINNELWKEIGESAV